MQKEIVQLEAKDIKVSQVIRYFWHKAIKYKWLVIGCLALETISLVASVYEPVYTSKILDIIEGVGWISSWEVMKALYYVLLIIWVLWLTKVSASQISTILLNWVSSSGCGDIMLECFQKLHNHSYRFFSNSFSGSLVRQSSKLSQSFDRITDLFVWTLLSIIITLPMMMVLIMRESLMLWIIFIWFWILFVALNLRFAKRNLKYERITNERDSKMSWELSDTITNAFNVMTFASQKREFLSFSKTVNTVRDLFRKKWNRITWNYLFLNIFSLTFRILCLGACIWLWWKWTISVGIIVLVQLYIGRYTTLLYNSERIFRTLSQTIWESTEMLAILNTPPEIQDKNNKKLKINLWKIEFKNVDFWYIKDDIVIDHLNLGIKPWEKVAIVGESGSWKTTLVKLLFRFFDVWNWSILVDWQDISKVTQESLRSQISMVPQDALLFHRSLKENIWYANPKATDEDIIKAAKMAKCHDFIMNLPDKYDSLVWERWIKLSWWERQRVAIARAILEKAKILVLDEATSSLDSESEYLIQSAMDEVMKNKTAIVIAHRLSTIMKMDRIIVMDEWVIVEEWTHDELVKKKGWVYHKLWSIQSWWFIVQDEWDKMNFSNEEKE